MAKCAVLTPSAQATELTLEDRITERLKSYQRQLAHLHGSDAQRDRVGAPGGSGVGASSGTGAGVGSAGDIGVGANVGAGGGAGTGAGRAGLRTDL